MEMIAWSARACAWERLSQPCHGTVRLDSPLPPAAAEATWQPHMQQAMHHALKHLTFQRKLWLPSVAASSGSQINLELTLSTLQPWVFDNFEPVFDPDVGAVAAQCGHLQLLRWLLQHDCPIGSFRTVEAATAHCDIAGLQEVWALLTHNPDICGKIFYGHLSVAVWAAGRSGASAVPELSWMLSKLREEGQRQCALVLAATAAAEAGNLRLLWWLLGKGLDLRSPHILTLLNTKP